ncbi:hypothetical protein HYU93_00115 [Candidatus Daviesbacteria bacterium]|nr:hypothetical protein [Candidatus Daviesbacteria bacterium]
MTKHGPHHNCLMCNMAKAVGIMEKPEHSIICSKCGMKTKSEEELKEHEHHHDING